MSEIHRNDDGDTMAGNPPKRLKMDIDQPNKATGPQHKRIAKKREEEPPLPQPFELPRNYPRAVQEGLGKGALTGKARTKFISAVAAAVFRYKSYPSRDEYDHVAEQVVSAYPFMCFGTGRGHVS